MDVVLGLTDEELSLIATSLTISIESYEKHEEINGVGSLDSDSKEVINNMKTLLSKLEKEYF